MGSVVIRPKARREINSILAHYIETVSIEFAKRFRKSAEQTFAELAETPLIGSPRKILNSEFQGVRMCRVRNFDVYLIFYLPTPNGVAIERVIHASQDYKRVLMRRRVENN